MATYVIGDVQGCFTALQCLLDKLAYSPSRDMLWFAGDLVNRGPQSLACLRWVSESGAQTVLGNHDLHLLAIYYGGREFLKRKDTLGEIIDADDADHLLSWLRCQPLLMYDVKVEGGDVMVFVEKELEYEYEDEDDEDDD